MQYLSNEQLTRMVPSVAATAAHESRSDRYGFLSTLDVVDALRGSGWYPVRAEVGNPRTRKSREYGKHMLRFRQHPDVTIEVGEVVPEIVCFNAHDGTAAYRFMAGLFRSICSNGLIVADDTFGDIRVMHTKYAIQEALTASEAILDAVPSIMGRVDAWKMVDLDRSSSLEFANEAAKLRPGILKPISAELLGHRRWADKKSDLWTTFNKVQENLIRGGTYGTKVVTIKDYRDGTNKDITETKRLRAIKAPKELVSVNRGLWNLADQFAKAA